jgi:hypothetical protein
MPLRMNTSHKHSLLQVAVCFQRWISRICSFYTVQFCQQQYCVAAVYFYVNMVKTKVFQTKEVITNNGQCLLGYITNYFTAWEDVYM